MLNENLRAMLIRHEGYRKTPYRCPSGYRTIGIGHNYDANPLPDDMQKHLNLYGFITERMIERLYQADVEIAGEACRELYPDFYAFTEDRRQALIDFVFNVGEFKAKTFVSTNRAINEQRWQDAANGLRKSLYYRQVGKRGEEIARMLEGDEPQQEKQKVEIAQDDYPLNSMGAI